MPAISTLQGLDFLHGWACKNDWTDRDAVLGGRRGAQRKWIIRGHEGTYGCLMANIIKQSVLHDDACPRYHYSSIFTVFLCVDVSLFYSVCPLFYTRHSARNKTDEWMIICSILGENIWTYVSLKSFPSVSSITGLPKPIHSCIRSFLMLIHLVILVFQCCRLHLLIIDIFISSSNKIKSTALMHSRSVTTAQQIFSYNWIYSSDFNTYWS